MPVKRTSTATALGAAALIALTGCGQSGSDASKGDTVPLTELGDTVDAAMKEAGTGSMKASSGKEELTSDFDLSEDRAASLSGKTGGQDLDVRFVDDMFYLKAPSPEMTQPGKSWIKVDPEGKEPADQQMAASLDSMTELSDPIAPLKGAGDVDAKVTGAEGDEVTYEIKLSKEQMAKAAKKQAEKAGDEQAAAMAAQGARATTVELVLDEKDRPVSSTTTVGEQKLTITYSDWGGDVAIEAPPADKVGTVEMPSQGQQPSQGSSGSSGSSGS